MRPVNSFWFRVTRSAWCNNLNVFQCVRKRGGRRGRRRRGVRRGPGAHVRRTEDAVRVPAQPHVGALPAAPPPAAPDLARLQPAQICKWGTNYDELLRISIGRFKDAENQASRGPQCGFSAGAKLSNIYSRWLRPK